jgi:hypothetical protein
VMGDEPLVAADDPGEVAHAGRLPCFQREGEGEAGRLTERLGCGCAVLELLDARQRGADPLGLRQIETKEVAGVGIVGDMPILHTHGCEYEHSSVTRQTAGMLTVYGACAVTFMMLMYAFESRGHGYILAFAGGCLLSSVYGFLSGAWPFGVVEVIWSGIAVRRYLAIGVEAEQDASRTPGPDAG